MDLVETVYRLSEKFPSKEQYGLTGQIRRAAVYVPSNIAEGSGRHSPKEFVQHLAIAYGSLCEMETQLLIASRLHYLTAPECDHVLQSVSSVGRLLKGLIRSLRE